MKNMVSLTKFAMIASSLLGNTTHRTPMYIHAFTLPTRPPSASLKEMSPIPLQRHRSNGHQYRNRPCLSARKRIPNDSDSSDMNESVPSKRTRSFTSSSSIEFMAESQVEKSMEHAAELTVERKMEEEINRKYGHNNLGAGRDEEEKEHGTNYERIENSFKISPRSVIPNKATMRSPFEKGYNGYGYNTATNSGSTGSTSTTASYLDSLGKQDVPTSMESQASGERNEKRLNDIYGGSTLQNFNVAENEVPKSTSPTDPVGQKRYNENYGRNSLRNVNDAKKNGPTSLRINSMDQIGDVETYGGSSLPNFNDAGKRVLTSSGANQSDEKDEKGNNNVYSGKSLQSFNEVEQEVLASTQAKLDVKRVKNAVLSSDESLSPKIAPTQLNIALAASLVFGTFSFLTLHQPLLSFLLSMATFFIASRDPVLDEDWVEGDVTGPIARIVGRATLSSIENTGPTLKAVARALIAQEEVDGIKSDFEQLERENKELKSTLEELENPLKKAL